MKNIPTKYENELAFTVEEICKILKIHSNTLYKMVKDDKIPYIRINDRKLLFPKQRVVEWLNQC